MDKLAIISMAVLTLVPNLNYQIPKLDTPRSDTVVVSFFNKPKVEFPDRTAQYQQAKDIDTKREAERAEQARLEAIKQAQAVQTPAPAQSTPTVAVNGSDDAFIQLSYCEAGGKPTTNTGNGYYGMFQYDLQTWGNYMGYARPDLAPAEVQLAKAKETQARRGWSPWPSCARKLGLL